MKNLIRFTAIITITLWFALTASKAFGQSDPCPAMPSGYLCVPRAVGVKALEDADTRKALEAENTVLKQALQDERADKNTIKIEFARVSGENTALKQNAVSDRAIIDLLLKNTRKKCLPLSICF